MVAILEMQAMAIVGLVSKWALEYVYQILDFYRERFLRYCYMYVVVPCLDVPAFGRHPQNLSLIKYF